MFGDLIIAKSYRDIQVPTGGLGYPTLALRDANIAVIGDWTGYLTLVDLDSGKVLRRSDIGSYIWKVQVCTLESVTVEPEHREWCCVATRAPCAALWNFDTAEIIKIEPATHAPVNTITFSPGEQLLAIGTGVYPLDGSERMAALEVWGKKDRGKWVCLRTARLPGVSCDALHWTQDATHILAVVGAVSQKETFVVSLDAKDLHAEALFRIDAAGPCQGRVTPTTSSGQQVLVGLRDRIVFLDLSEDVATPILWARKVDGAARFAYDNQNETLLTRDGHLLRSCTGEVVRDLPPLEGCADVALRPNGGFVGVSENGVLRCWENVARPG